MLLHFAQTCASSVVLIVSDCAADMAKVEKQKVLECLVLGEKNEYSDQFNLWKSRSYGEQLSLLPPCTYLFHGEQFMIYQTSMNAALETWTIGAPCATNTAVMFVSMHESLHLPT